VFRDFSLSFTLSLLFLPSTFVDLSSFPPDVAAVVVDVVVVHNISQLFLAEKA